MNDLSMHSIVYLCTTLSVFLSLSLSPASLVCVICISGILGMSGRGEE